MNSKEYKEKLSEQIRSIHREVAAFNAYRERKEQAELREKLKAQRKALSPISDEEAAEKSQTQQRKSIEETIENGTPEERAAMVISDSDLYRTYGIPQKLSTADKMRLQTNLNKRPQEERNVFLFYIKEYDRLTEYYQRLYTFSKKFQVEATLLMNLITKWEDYDREAETCTKLYHAFIDSQLWKGLDGRTVYTSEAEEFPLCYRNNFFKAHKNWKEATLLFDEATQTFKADIDGEGKLYEQILAQAEDTKKHLSNFKAMVEVAEDYIFNEVAYFVEPLQMENTIENTREERYLRGLDGRLRYFRSELNERKEKGETVSPEDEKRAVYPDYYEVEADETTKRDAREFLYKLM